MEPSGIIQAGLDYIEQNLKADIAGQELADMAGYSLWHYCRVFAQVTGDSVAAYIVRRRLDRALGEIAGGCRGADAALAYGFDTYAGFYKAFVRMYGCSPRKYLALYGTHKAEKEMTVIRNYSKKDLREILAHWDIPQNLPIGDVLYMDDTKVADDVWNIGEAYILRTGQRDKLMRRMRVPRLLAGRGVSMALPVPTKAGADILDGADAFLLTTRVPGAALPKSERFGADRAAFGFKYGQSIARLHRALAAIEADALPDASSLYAQVVEWALPQTRLQNVQWSMGLPESFFGSCLGEFGALYPKLPKQLIHRDPNPCNILFDGGEVSGFIDFDLSERNLRLWDPCYCATGLLSEWRGVEGIQAKWPAILEGILRGYDSVNPLTPEEKQAVFHVICSIQMIFIAWCEPRNEWKELAKTNRDMLRFIAEGEGEIRRIMLNG